MSAFWRVCCGQLSKRTVEATDNGDGTISVSKKDRRGCMVREPKIARYTSYHPTRQEAIAHILEQAQRDVNEAHRGLLNAKRRLASARAKFINEVSAAGAETKP